LGSDQGIRKTALSPKLAAQDAAEIAAGTARFYVLSWAGWTDPRGTRGEVHSYLWLKFPDNLAGPYSKNDLSWRFCDE